MLVKNNWNKPLERVYLLADIYDDTGVVSTFESASHTIDAGSKYSFNSSLNHSKIEMPIFFRSIYNPPIFNAC